MRIVLRALRAAWFSVWFTWELIMANAVVAWDIVTPRHRMRPGIVRVPIRSRTDLEVVMLANFVSLTPGTLTLEVGEAELFVHAMFVASPERVRRQVQRLEDRLIGFLR